MCPAVLEGLAVGQVEVGGSCHPPAMTPSTSPAKGCCFPRMSLQCCWRVAGMSQTRARSKHELNGDKAPVQGTVLGVVQGTVLGLTL